MNTLTHCRVTKRRCSNKQKIQRQNKVTHKIQATRPLDQLDPVNRYAAGIDVGSAENYVAMPSALVADGESAIRVFGVFSNDQDALVEWLRAHRIITVAMEATGIYWMSLYDKLEAAGLEVYLVDPHAVKTVPGRKSDWLDCQWLQKLHTYGLLNRAFRPDAPIRRLRTLTRQRTELIMASSMHQLQMEKALISMNLQLNLVISDIIGETGLRIIRAILAGQRDAKELIKLRDGRCRKSTVEEMQSALTGTYDEEQLFILGQNLAAWEFFQKQIEKCDQKIMPVLDAIPTAKPALTPAPAKSLPLAEKPEPKTKRTDRGHNALNIDPTQALCRICRANLMKVCGLNVLSVLMLIGEIGVDMTRWRSARAFCSWMGLCPGTKISGGKILSRKTRKVKNRAATILRMAAWAAGKTDTWIGRFYRRIKMRRGPAKAVTATARKLACVIYHMLRYGDEFVLLDTDAYEANVQKHRIKRLQKEAKLLGFNLIETE